MKKIITMAFLAAAVLSAAMTFTSCNSDSNDEPNGGKGGTTEIKVNPLKVFTGGLPKSAAGMTIQTNDKGQISAIQAEDKKITFEYIEPTTRVANSPNVIMTVEGSLSKDVCNLYLGKDGFVKHCDETEIYKHADTQKETWDFTYNNDGQLLTMLRSEGGYEKTIVKYNGGNILETITTSAENPNINHSYKIFYTSESVPSPIVNKDCLMLFDQTLGIDMDEMRYAYYAGLLGKATKNLPVRLVNKEREPENFSWILNTAGYPISFKGSYYPYYNYSFIW